MRRELLDGDRRRGMCGLRGHQPWRSWSSLSSAKARKEVKLDTELKVWHKANFSMFFAHSVHAGHVPARGYVWEKRGFRSGSSHTKGNQNLLNEGEWGEQCADVSPADLIPVLLCFPEIML